jgi:fibronectin-binding autotransporter adhesin
VSFAPYPCRLILALAVFVALTVAPKVRAQANWTGTSGTDGNWSTVANWNGGGQPSNGSAVTFDVNSTGTLTTNNDLVTSLASISVSNVPGTAGTNPITIAGNALTLGSGGITLNGTTAATQNLTIGLVANSLSLSASQSWGINARTLTVNNNIALSTTAGTTLTLNWTGAGSIVLNGNISDGAAPSAITTTASSNTAATLEFLGSNSYSGGTTIIARTENVQIGSGSAFGTGPISFTAGGNPAVLQAVNGSQTLGNTVTISNGFSFGGSNNLTLNGPVTAPSGKAITYNGAAGTALTFGSTVTIGTSGSAAGTLTTSIIAGTASPSGSIVFNGVLSQAAGSSSGLIVALTNGTATAFSSDQFNAQNTYSGGTTMTGTGCSVTVGSSSVLSGSTILSGPLGTGAVTVNNATALPKIQAANGPQSVANNFTLTSSLTVQGSNNLTLSGALTGAGGIQMIGSGTLNLTGNSNTFSSSALATAVTAGTLAANNTSGSATGTSVVNVTGTGAAGSGGTLGGAGFISGNVTVSTATPGSPNLQGGTIAPGNSPGTLTMTGASVTTLNPVGTYAFDYDATATGPNAPIGGGSDLLKGTGTSSLSLVNLTTAAGGQFNLTLNPVGSPTPPAGQVTYTIADFSGSGNATPIVVPTGFSGTNLTPYFVVGGQYNVAFTPTVMLNNGNQIQVTFSPVPEPAFILAACGGIAGLAAWRKSRRRHAIS